MKILHFSNWAPRRSGLFEAVKDQIKFERKLGIDSQMALFETENPDKNLLDDNWLSPISWNECENADIYVIHRGLPQKFDTPENKKKVITVIHGTVEYLMLEEIISDANKTPFNTHINLIKDCAASVAVNPHDYDIYKLYDANDKLSMIHDAIDTERFTIDGYSHEFLNHPQILFCDSLRVNKHPAHAIWCMDEVVKNIPNAKLTVIGLELLNILTWRNLILRSPNRNMARNLEMIQFMHTDIRPYFKGADILINGNMSGIPSRVELEAMACGCQVISFSDSFTKWCAKPFDIKDMAKQITNCWEYIQKDKAKARLEARQWVLDNASMEKKVTEEYIPLYNKILKK